MNRKQDGFIRFGTMTLLVSGLAFFGLLIYGMTSGQELPLWPAIAVALVNVIAAAKIIMTVKNGRSQQQAPASSLLGSSDKTVILPPDKGRQK
ncbi:hypothetical protein [Aromatoleum aromaticum]|uniref:Transmembrane protein n=1 Tax=Aromatoleum aromaticum (strain DSM 19018 / LMG 30748 / EbN1) TaxID=76114 RepID=Q5NZZ7_AROAE|nr:hypothetical protein [Aromatoleum aromaticum]NMG56564.1 hypothetical protein [Aromatoleum aromaticum]CAI09367.1 hypothetical protein ebA5711 [Aromatoleum aromaticum EbN1]